MGLGAVVGLESAIVGEYVVSGHYLSAAEASTFFLFVYDQFVLEDWVKVCGSAFAAYP